MGRLGDLADRQWVGVHILVALILLAACHTLASLSL